MIHLFKNKAFWFVITLFFWTTTILADGGWETNGTQEDTDPGGVDGDPSLPAAPIYDWIALLLLVGIVLAFYYIRKRKPIQQ